ncbi:MAG TPA: ATP-binding protein [Gaiellaceae bacterium]|nr:ATP-binding protein [Gaiellaceae bacterium]
MSRLPIRLRVTAAFAVAMAAVLASTGLFLYLRLSSHLTTAVNRELQLRAQDLAVLVADPRSSLVREGGTHLVEHGESYAQLLAPDGRVLDATAPRETAPLLDAQQRRAAAREPLYVDLDRVPGLDEASRVLATSVRRGGQPALLLVGTTLSDRSETLADFRNELLIAGPIALLLASGLGYLLAGLSLRQVESMRRRAAAISAETPGDRLPVPPTGDELERLGVTLNAMLGRLESALERERAFVADAGHELRTPLALLRTELELALRQAGSEDELREAVRRSSQEVDRLSQLAEGLLLIARSDRGNLPLRVETLDVRPLFESVVNRVEWRAEAEGKRVVGNANGVAAVRGDQLRLEQALTNLVDNALRYGGDQITLTATPAGGHTELHVRDNGSGFPAGFLDEAFERFSRADAARGRGGAGLGLAIVRTIARAHGGSAHAANRTPGADVWLSLPDRG